MTSPVSEYHLESLNWFLGPADESLDYYVTRTRGYLVPPSDSQYQFVANGDDDVKVYLSRSADPADKVKVIAMS